jgi:hypothetical protein
LPFNKYNATGTSSNAISPLISKSAEPANEELFPFNSIWSEVEVEEEPNGPASVNPEIEAVPLSFPFNE